MFPLLSIRWLLISTFSQITHQQINKSDPAMNHNNKERNGLCLDLIKQIQFTDKLSSFHLLIRSCP